MSRLQLVYGGNEELSVAVNDGICLIDHLLPECTVDGFLNQHEWPFREGLDDMVFNGHDCRFAEGHYTGWFGWSNLTMTSSSGLMGLPASDRRIHMRVVDMYRQERDQFAENWIFIDMLHWMVQKDVVLLARMRKILRR